MAAVTVKKDVPQWRTTIPRTKPSCAWSVRTHSCLVRFHTFTLWTNKTSCQCHEWVKKCAVWTMSKYVISWAKCVSALADSYLAIAGAREQGGEAWGVLGHAVHPISVSIQRGQERLGKHSVKLSGIQSLGVLSAHLEWMKCWVIVSRDWEQKEIMSW